MKTLKDIDDIEEYTPDEIGDLIFSEANINLALEKTFFERMKNSGDWARSSENKGYQELFDIIERFNKNSFLSQVAKAYHLDELKQKLVE
jgi:hypothetical protein